jgi:hypothetical protein
MMKPAMSPLIRRTSMVASVPEETIGRNAGLGSGGSDWPGSMKCGGIQRHQDRLRGLGADDIQGIGRGLVFGQRGNGRGELHGDARADDDHGHAREHGAIERGQVRHLDFFEEIDADRVGMAFAGEEDLDEVGGDAQFLGREVALDRVHAGGLVARIGGAAAGDEIGVEDAAGDLREGEVLEGAADMPFGIAVLQAAREDFVEGGAGDDAQLAQPGDGLGEAPVGHSGAHAALDDLGDPNFHSNSLVGSGPDGEGILTATGGRAPALSGRCGAAWCAARW